MALRFLCRSELTIRRNFFGIQHCLKYSDESKLKNEKNKANKENKTDEKSKNASERLNFLLQEIIQDGAPSKLSLARPKQRMEKPKMVKKKRISDESSILDESTVKAANDVAVALGGDVQRTESELLSKLRRSSPEQNDVMDVGKVLAGMQVERREPPSRAEQARNILSKQGMRTKTFQTFGRYSNQDRNSILGSEPQRIDLYGSAPLGIFDPNDTGSEEPQLPTWNRLHERELRLAVTHPPSNHFEQMIIWTEQGKLWKFPIDNEQGMEKEQQVCFTEHVFLERHLENWCPNKGPIRHFMELVCVGLSKNYYLSADEKKAHIDWFKNYFAQKKELLADVGAVPTEKNEFKEI